MEIIVGLVIVIAIGMALTVLKTASSDRVSRCPAPRRWHDEWSPDLPSRPYTER